MLIMNCCNLFTVVINIEIEGIKSLFDLKKKEFSLDGTAIRFAITYLTDVLHSD